MHGVCALAAAGRSPPFRLGAGAGSNLFANGVECRPHSRKSQRCNALGELARAVSGSTDGRGERRSSRAWIARRRVCAVADRGRGRTRTTLCELGPPSRELGQPPREARGRSALRSAHRRGHPATPPQVRSAPTLGVQACHLGSRGRRPGTRSRADGLVRRWFG